MSCIFCEIIDGKAKADIIYQTDQFIVFKDIRHRADIHLLVVPKKHIQNLMDLAPEDNKIIEQMMLLLPVIAKVVDVSGFRTIINTGRSGGQHIDHLHAHFLAGDLAVAP